MDFFQAQADAERRSSLLIVLFAAAVLAIIVAIYAAIHLVAGPGLGRPFQPALFAVVAAGVLLVVGAGSAFRTLQLRRGGPAVAELLGGRRVSAQASDADERRLVNVVEEMAIASGVPVPAIYVLDGEMGINAFAAGHTIHDAAVAVTRGTLERLSRDELQGVIAHEFSHILNGDMRLNIRLMGLLFGILLLAVVGRGLLRVGSNGSRSSRKKDGGGQIALIGLALVVVGYIGVFFGRLIQAAISRQREFLADAAAVQFTRNPAGIAGALKVIGAHGDGSRIENSHAEEAGHLFFAGRARSAFAGFMATHPPLVERIRRIEPAFDGRFDRIPLRPAARPDALADALAGAGARPAPTSAPGGEPTPEHALPEGVLAPLQFLASVGVPTADHLLRAGNLLAAMPEPLREAARSPEDVPALLFALLYDPAAAGAEAGAAVIRRYGGEAILERTKALAAQVRAGGPMARFPLLGIALPTLQALPPERIEALLPTVDALIHADGKVDAFEHALTQHLQRQLAKKPARRPRGTVHSLVPLREPLQTVLSALAHTGSDDDGAAQAALDAAARMLPPGFGALTLRSKASTTPAAVRDALEQLAAGSPGVLRRILLCATHVISADGEIRYTEAELLRAVAGALDCPVPALLATPAAAER
jgi:Zn-dependent protease with chaperone function